MIRTHRFAAPFVALVWLLALVPFAAAEGPRFGVITRFDPRFDSLVPADAKLEKLEEGFEWSEGPVWFPEDGGYLLFSDIPLNSVLKWQAGKGISLFLKPSGYTGSEPFEGPEPGSNGLLRDKEGRLILCEHGDRRVARLEKDGTKTVLADRYQGKRLNSPNDGAIKSNGDIYFTDPPFGLPLRMEDPRRELDFCGVFRIGTDGSLTLLNDDTTRPNGIAFSPDEKTLYVAQSDPAAALWRAFDVKEDGTLGAVRVFYDATAAAQAGGKGGCDGMKVDAQGNLFCTGPGGVHVFSPDGTLLGKIETDERNGNVAWGEDGSTLFIMADMYLCRVKTSTKGAGW